MVATEDTPLLGQAPRPARYTSWRHVGLAVLALAIASCCLTALVPATPEPALDTTLAEFDLIVVGAGPAGSVFASKIVQATNFTVLLIEAGDASQRELGGETFISFHGKEMPYTPFDVPYYWSDVSRLTDYHWNVPNVLIAKALGGCGIHNAMLYVRALPSDIVAWGLAPTWTWPKALAIYLATEAFAGPKVEHHGYDGIVQTSAPTQMDGLSNQFLAACTQRGVPTSSDFNAPNERLGAGTYHFNIRHGMRESAAKAFLGPFIAKKLPEEVHNRLHLWLNTTVERVDLEGGVAKGVFVHTANGGTQYIASKRGVVLTAGAIHTPKLLTLSGVAAANVLEALDIPVQVDAPLVGGNLQDHPAIAMTFAASHPLQINFSLAWDDYLETRGGWLSTTGLSAGAFFASPGRTVPDLQLTFFPRKSEPVWATREPGEEVLFTIALLSPEARNRVVVTSKNASEPCRVDSEIPEAASEHLSEADARRLLFGIAIVRDLAIAPALAPLLGGENMPGAALESDDELVAWVYANVYRNSHWVGSAKMGSDASNSVVSASLRVWNTSNLFVADASVIPVIPNGNVHSTVVMVATHAATLIADAIKA
ncbi:choline dehydrogenase [Achlya hypogyna]|uniref:Choline dehydrogenase n=1 Tax=Achlya hypogyna TaxID=1202772 RepID=A0A1V9ZRQ4_ACHHY|nr:choline dehydrogenase [Achlya hypogyna]